MIESDSRLRDRRGEEGQTIALVALAMVALLAMAALAIDVVSLYVARGEAQRAADAAALAGAKMFVASGYTSVQAAGTSAPVQQSDVCVSGSPGGAAANLQAIAAAQANQIAGQPAAIQSITCNFASPGNPQITVTVHRDGLSVFFSRIWNSAGSSVSATATAEAYNPSGYTNHIQVTGPKPWLLANCDPNNRGPGGNPNCPGGGPGNYNYFIDSTGNPANNGAAIGEIIELTRINANGTQTGGSFVAMDLGITGQACPSGTNWNGCDNIDSNNYENQIACATPATLRCGQQNVTVLSSGGGGGPGGRLGSQTREATECLIHEDDDGICNGQDIFLPEGGATGGGRRSCTYAGSGSAPVRIAGGYNNPDNTLANSTNISRSDSVVTVPLFDGSTSLATACGTSSPCMTTVSVVGFLQLGLTCSVNSGDAGCVNTGGGGTPTLEAVVMNEVGCPATPTGTPVTGSGASPIPVRLIH
jgi:Putative Flp pilus-assembly TadE/G-like